MELDFKTSIREKSRTGEESLSVGGVRIPVYFVYHRFARRYILRVKGDGSLRVTVPRGGSRRSASEFAEQNREWVYRQIERLHEQARRAPAWNEGTEILFRGERVVLRAEAEATGQVAIMGVERILLGTESDWKPRLVARLRWLAERELVRRTMELAALHGVKVRKVAVRNQRSRWGSCSMRGTVSLNWRLIQTPPMVRDYIILHELMHLRELNHSARFWRHVRAVCPDFAEAEAWLARHGDELR